MQLSNIFFLSAFIAFAQAGSSLQNAHKLFARQSYCPAGETICGDGCIENTWTCCPSGNGGCEPGYDCELGDNGEYGCCPSGENCVGDGGAYTSYYYTDSSYTATYMYSTTYDYTSYATIIDYTTTSYGYDSMTTSTTTDGLLVESTPMTTSAVRTSRATTSAAGATSSSPIDQNFNGAGRIVPGEGLAMAMMAAAGAVAGAMLLM